MSIVGASSKIPERAALLSQAPRAKSKQGGEERASEENFSLRRPTSEGRFICFS